MLVVRQWRHYIDAVPHLIKFVQAAAAALGEECFFHPGIVNQCGHMSDFRFYQSADWYRIIADCG